MAHYNSPRFLLEEGSGSGINVDDAEGDEENEYWFPPLAYKVYYPIIWGLIGVAVLLLLCACMGWTYCCTVCCRKSRKGKMDVRQLEEQDGIVEGERLLSGGGSMAQNGALHNTTQEEGVRMDLELTEMSGEAIERRESALLQERADPVEREGELGGGETEGQDEQQTARNELTSDPARPRVSDTMHSTDTEQARAVHKSQGEAEAKAGREGVRSKHEVVCTAEVHEVKEDEAANLKDKRLKPGLPPPLDMTPPAPTDNEHGEEDQDQPSSAENPPTSCASYASNSLPNAFAATGKMAVSPPASATLGRSVQTTPPSNRELHDNTLPQTNTQHGGYFVEVDILLSSQSHMQESTPGRRHSADQQPSLHSGPLRQKKGAAVDRPLSLDQVPTQTTEKGTRRYSADQEPILLTTRLPRELTAADRNSGEQETAPNSTSSLLAPGSRMYTEARGHSKTQEETEQTDV